MNNKNKESITIPVCYYIGDDGKYYYDLESMAGEFEIKLSEITGRVIMCSAIEE